MSIGSFVLAQAQPAPGDLASGHVVLWILLAGLGLVVLGPSFRGCATWIHSTVRARRSNHLIMYLVGAVLAAGSVALFDVLDLSQILGGKIVTRDKWLVPIFVVVGSLTLWVSAQAWWLEHLLGIQLDELERTLESEREAAEDRLKLEQGQLNKVQSERDDLGALVKAHVAVLQERKRRLAKLLTTRRSSDDPKPVCAMEFMAAMDPLSQRQDLLRALHNVLLHRLNAKGEGVSINARLRLALFADQDGYMSVEESFDGQQFNVINSPMREYREQFRIDPQNSLTLAVALLRSEVPIIVSDTHDSDAARGVFRFFSPQHEETILSVAGFRVDDGSGHAGRRMTFVLDSNVRGFFNSLDRPLVDLFRDTMKTRLQYECQLYQVGESLCCSDGCCNNRQALANNGHG